MRLGYAARMISLVTIDDLRRYRHTLGLYCTACDRWAEADLERLARSGNGSRELVALRFRCSRCGCAADKQVRPPVPAPVGAVAYI
ncbi:MAG: hypothetical protein OEW35_20020 [Gammaproteobacteria bacterium]|nr:hypothetical protein [Gammaproteobacteria bacterium]